MLITLRINPDTFRDLVVSSVHEGRPVLALQFVEYLESKLPLGNFLPPNQQEQIKKVLSEADATHMLTGVRVPAYSQNKWTLEIVKLEEEHD